MRHRDVAAKIAAAIADRLASPSAARPLGHPQGWHPQSLAYGAAGVALLHIERARAGLGPWQRAHDWITCAAAGPVELWADSHLHYGVPAITFVLHAAADRPGRYAHARDRLDRHVTKATRDRLGRAHARMDRGALPTQAEFDSIRGMSGIGAHLLRREPYADLLRDVLAYVVRLTEPLTDDGEQLPGWWSQVAPSGRPSPDYPGGHANHGMAHGIAGPLALLALAARSGITVPGQRESIRRICDWFDRWRQDGPAGPWWPYVLTRAQLRGEKPLIEGPSRPSWCYGAAGHARSQQLAALALGDSARQQAAENALARALTDSGHVGLTKDRSLCHGYAGLAHIAAQASANSFIPDIAACVPNLLTEVGTRPDTVATSLLHSPGGDIGLLEGAAGVALALHTAASDAPPLSGWDAFLLIN